MPCNERRARARRVIRLAGALMSAGLLAGCFQPLYSQHSLVGGPGIRDAMSSVKVLPIAAPLGSSLARLAVQTRNDLLFDLTGGGSPLPPTHELTIRLVTTRTSVIVDLNSQRPDVEISSVDAYFTLKEIATGKVVVTGTTFARVSYDVPGSEQRFARIRGLRDAENRACKEIADNIRTRLASYFVAGT
jgi:LPS-assembly lipoprotein